MRCNTKSKQTQTTKTLSKIGASLLAVLMLCAGAVQTPGAETANETYNWYCAHVKEHAQPCADERFHFIRDCGGYYIDEKRAQKAPEEQEKVVYLTFDAGYENGNVEKILDALKEASAQGAFFVLGHLVQKNPELVRRMAEEGHLVCNHSYAHKDMTAWSRSDIEAELARLDDACREIGVEPAPFFRPPEGRFSRSLLEAASGAGYRTVFWSFGYADWDNAAQPTTAVAMKKILDNLHDGEVMLLHPTSATNAAILPELLVELKRQGYRFGSLYELVGESEGVGHE